MEYFQRIRTRDSEWAAGVELFFVHQKDRREFNRGAMKNIGAIHVRRSFPGTWKDINLVFHDVDTLPRRHIWFSYSTLPGVVAHYYGVPGILGGVFVIKCGDFMSIGGFPNIWGWGFEDNALHERAIKGGLMVDHSDLIGIRDYASICRLDADSEFRTISSRDTRIYKQGNADTIYHIRDLDIEEDGHMLHVMSFEPYYPHPEQLRTISLKEVSLRRQRARIRMPNR